MAIHQHTCLFCIAYHQGKADANQHTDVFAIGTFFALMDAFNNGANDVANAWATSVSSRSISYRQAMVLGTIFEMLGVSG